MNLNLPSSTWKIGKSTHGPFRFPYTRVIPKVIPNAHFSFWPMVNFALSCTFTYFIMYCENKNMFAYRNWGNLFKNRSIFDYIFLKIYLFRFMCTPPRKLLIFSFLQFSAFIMVENDKFHDSRSKKLPGDGRW